MKGTGYPLHSPVSPSLPHPCVTVCHHISTGLYLNEAALLDPITLTESRDQWQALVTTLMNFQFP